RSGSPKRCGPTSAAAICSKPWSPTRNAMAATAASSLRRRRSGRSARSESVVDRQSSVISRQSSGIKSAAISCSSVDGHQPKSQQPSVIGRRSSVSHPSSLIRCGGDLMTRVLSGAALIAIAVGVVWFASDLVFELFAALLLVLGVRELIVLAAASDLPVATLPGLVSAVLTAWVVGTAGAAGLEVALMAALVAIGLGAMGAWRGGTNALATV